MAAGVARAIRKHLAVASTTTSLIRPLLLTRRRLVQLSPPSASRFIPIRCWISWPHDIYWPVKSPPPPKVGTLFPGGEKGRWLILMDKPGGEGATAEQMILVYLQTLAEVVGSEEEAAKKIYKFSCERYFGFCCEIDEETSNKLKESPGLVAVLPDPEYNAYLEENRTEFDPSIPKRLVRDELSWIKEKMNRLSSCVERLESCIMDEVGDHGNSAREGRDEDMGGVEHKFFVIHDGYTTLTWARGKSN